MPYRHQWNWIFLFGFKENLIKRNRKNWEIVDFLSTSTYHSDNLRRSLKIEDRYARPNVLAWTSTYLSEISQITKWNFCQTIHIVKNDKHLSKWIKITVEAPDKSVEHVVAALSQVIL